MPHHLLTPYTMGDRAVPAYEAAYLTIKDQMSQTVLSAETLQ